MTGHTAAVQAGLQAAAAGAMQQQMMEDRIRWKHIEIAGDIFARSCDVTQIGEDQLPVLAHNALTAATIFMTTAGLFRVEEKEQIIDES